MKQGSMRYLAFLFMLFSCPGMMAQDWELAKERDGIIIYTRHDSSSTNKSFKGEIDLKSDVNTVGKLIEDVRNFDVWDEDIRLIKVLEAEPGKFIRYYVQYDVQWPFDDRDLFVSALITTDPLTGNRIIASTSDLAATAPDPEYIRIENYWQKWTISPISEGKVHLVLEGFADPAGEVPSWLSNLAITSSPLNMLKKIREAVE